MKAFAEIAKSVQDDARVTTKKATSVWVESRFIDELKIRCLAQGVSLSSLINSLLKDMCAKAAKDPET